MSFDEATELEQSEVDVPDTVIDLFEADILTDAGGGDIDPLAIPSNAAVGADVADFEAVRIFEGR